MAQKVKGGWCNDFYRSQLWNFDQNGQIISKVGAQNLVLDILVGDRIGVNVQLNKNILLGESSQSWSIEENSKVGGLQIRNNLKCKIIDASRGDTNICISNTHETKKRPDRPYGWPENWATCWTLTTEKGYKAQNFERNNNTLASKLNTAKIDINVNDKNGRNALCHAIMANECGIGPVRTKTIYYQSDVQSYFYVRMHLTMFI